ncbi:hypothetical protein CV103_11920 [Sphingomonas fennica]|uniref:Uncharacterized protein n=1 Tax=Edaphosphingomonas fennica TaxID=114404 RepID=A0A2T4HVQ8_9SPHN|nr:hypothetical protein CV103_11920 [Sphingomonas fennica]
MITAFGQFGPLGLMIWYLVWRERTGAEKRDQIERERIESDKALASALTALTVTINNMDRRAP